MNACFVLTICSVAASTIFFVDAAEIGAEESTTELEVTDQPPKLSVNPDYCFEVYTAIEDLNKCLGFIKSNGEPGLRPADREKAQQAALFNNARIKEKIPLDLQVFVPSENSWYLQDSHNNKFLGRPLQTNERLPLNAPKLQAVEKNRERRALYPGL